MYDIRILSVSATLEILTIFYNISPLGGDWDFYFLAIFQNALKYASKLFTISLFFTVLSYDWAHYVSEAIKKCDSTEVDCLKLALESTNYTGAWGDVTYSPLHATKRPRKLVAYKQGIWQDI